MKHMIPLNESQYALVVLVSKQVVLWYGHYFSGLEHSSSSSTQGLSVWLELAGVSLFCVGRRRYSSSSALMATLSGDSQRLNCSKALQENQDRIITRRPFIQHNHWQELFSCALSYHFWHNVLTHSLLMMSAFFSASWSFET